MGSLAWTTDIVWLVEKNLPLANGQATKALFRQNHAWLSVQLVCQWHLQ